VCKKPIKNSQPFVKKMKKYQVPWGGDFFDSRCSNVVVTDTLPGEVQEIWH